MTQPLIKIIKRGTRIDIQPQNDPAAITPPVKAESAHKREMVKIIGGWIEERREQSRLTEIIARGNPFSELLVNKG